MNLKNHLKANNQENETLFSQMEKKAPDEMEMAEKKNEAGEEKEKAEEDMILMNVNYFLF